MRRLTPLGTSNFKKIREENRYFVDKSLLVRHVLQGNDISLFCRPRRFGKTLNMEMLRCFFTNDADNCHLFEGLQISRDAESMAHLGKYPIVFLSLKEIKPTDGEGAFWRIRNILIEIWENYGYLAQDSSGRQLHENWSLKLKNKATPSDEIARSLRKLCELLAGFHGERVVLLTDEYDTPIHASWLHGYYDSMLEFMKELLGSAMKDNPYLKKRVLTGILRVSKESMFSDLNNFIPSTVLDTDIFSDMFGFTEAEVREMLRYYDLNGRELEELHQWYDGYRFEGHVIYNPWSVLNYVFSLNHALKPYWVNTSQDSLLRQLIFGDKSGIQDYLQRLLDGEQIILELDEHLVFKDLRINQRAVWTLLMLSGYLRAENADSKHHRLYKVSIPNKEVREAFTDSIRNWLQSDMEADTRQKMLDALAAGHVKDFEWYLSDFVIQVFSFHDTQKRYAENFYHAFFLGLLAGLENRYQLRSNHEAGLGRYDICLTPHNKNDRGIIIEIKAPNAKRDETIKVALANAVRQIKITQYETGLKAAGVKEVLDWPLRYRAKR